MFISNTQHKLFSRNIFFVRVNFSFFHTVYTTNTAWVDIFGLMAKVKFFSFFSSIFEGCYWMKWNQLFLIEYDSLAFLRRKIENFYYDEESHWINSGVTPHRSNLLKRHFERTSLKPSLKVVNRRYVHSLLYTQFPKPLFRVVRFPKIGTTVHY